MNFTIADILFCGLTFLLFAMFLIPPGYALGWALELADFRKQDPGIRFLLSLPFSIALLPIVVYLLGRYSFDWPVTGLYALLFAAFCGVSRWRGLRVPWIVWIVSAVWIAIAFLSLSDLQLGNKLYYSVVGYDLNFRTAITGAFERAHSLPAANPFFTDGNPQPFRYHYFWFMLCALPVRLAYALFGYTGLTPRHGVIASSAWTALALSSLVVLYGRFFFEWEESTRRRATIIALLLIGISGLDIIPLLLVSRDGLLPTMDWWNTDQVTGWLDTILWVPHALAALIACLTGFLILWNRPRVRLQDAFGAALAFASATGLSVYVTLVFAVFAMLWTAIILRNRDWYRAFAWAATGIVAGAMSLPFLHELSGKAEGSFLTPGIREFLPAMRWLYAHGSLTVLTSSLANLVFLPLNYFLELGFFAVAGWVFIRRKAAGPSELAARLMLLSSLILCSILRSNTIQMNDFGARGMLVPQFILLMWGAGWLAEPSGRSWLVKATLAIGLVSSVFELGLLRSYPVLADNGILDGNALIDPDDDLGLRDFSARQVYETLDRTLPAMAVVQQNPDRTIDFMSGLYSKTFTGDPIGPEVVMAPLHELFEGKRNDATSVCQQLGIDALFVTDVDPAWDDKANWPWQMPVLAKADRAIAVKCR
jgi:hypothetical protein